MKKWDKRFLELAAHISEWSKDPTGGVGVVLVMPSNPREYYTGYNGFPRGVLDYVDRYTNKKIKHPLIVHAELNAIFNAQRDVQGWAIYSTRFPCIKCASAIIQSGITQIVTYFPTANDMWKHRDEYILTITVLEEAGVYVQLISENQEMCVEQMLIQVENSEQRPPQNYIGG